MSIEAMKQALEALESYHGYMEPLTTVFGGPRVPAEQSTTGKVEKAITNLRTAIEAAEKQEPVAYMGTDIEGNPNKFRLNPFNGGVALYKKPQSVKVWDAEGYDSLMQQMEMVKAENLRLKSAAPVQEPVYYEVRMRIRGNTHNENNGWGWGFWESCSKNAAADYENSQDPQWEYEVRRLYTTPPAAQRPVAEPHKWVGLTDEELEMLNDCGDTDSYKFARAIEAKLKEKNHG